jgi:hypothetical protein
MSVKTEFVLSSDNNEKIITLDEWVTTLSQEEQEKFQRAQIRQRKFRQDAIDKGNMIISKGDANTNEGSYIWKDEETARVNKKTDGTWLVFWNRYIAENNLKFEIVKTQE